jgi:hypothetical protein
MISEVESLLQEEVSLEASLTGEVGETETGGEGVASSTFSSEDSLSMSMPASQGQRAMLPSKTTPSE